MSGILHLSAARLVLLSERLAALRGQASPGALLSVTLALGDSDTWLARAPDAGEFCYWARPAESLYQLGLGQAVVCFSAGPARFTALQAAYNGIAADWRHEDPQGTGVRPRACLGFAFDEDAGDDLPNARLAVPAILLRTDAAGSTATFTTPAREAGTALQRWRSLLAGHRRRWLRIDPGLRDTQLSRRAWQARVHAALAEITGGRLDKVVLSRTRRHALPDSARAADGFALLPKLVKRHAESTIYAIGHAGALFLGATPERLIGLHDGVARADALAGTAWADRPLGNDKETGEQHIVLEAVRDALATLCESVTHPAQAVEMHVGHLRHLRTPVEGRIRPGTGLFDLVAALHPTPAVGGWPQDAALAWLRRAGERRPGWYAGGVGWIDADGNGDIAVALRCGLISGRQLTLAAGAGIVPESTAEQEFAETEAKFGAMLEVMSGDALDATDARRTGTA